MDAGAGIREDVVKNSRLLFANRVGRAPRGQGNPVDAREERDDGPESELATVISSNTALRRLVSTLLRPPPDTPRPGSRRSLSLRGVQELLLQRRRMRQRLGSLRGHADVLENVGDGGVLGDECDNLHLGAAIGA